MICSIKYADGRTSYHQWGLNCKELNMTDEQCSDLLDDFKVTDRDQRDEFFNAFVNSRPLTAADFPDIAVYVTQGGGLAKWVEDRKSYVFLTPPAAGIQLGVGDNVPEEWGVQPVEFEAVESVSLCDTDI